MHKRNMLDVFFISMFLLSVLTINVSNVEAAETKISVQPSSKTVGQEGDLLPTSPFTINITVQDVEDLKVWQIVLYYNPTILSTRRDLIKIPLENIFKGEEDRLVRVYPIIETDTEGTYILFGACLSGSQPGVTGSGVLCQITFTGRAPGTSELNLKIKTQNNLRTWLENSKDENADLKLDEIPCSIDNGQVTVKGIENPLEPSAITINVNPSIVTIGSNVTITGTINQTRVGVNVTIYYNTAVGTAGTLATVQTIAFNVTHCRYEYNWTTEEGGVYNLYAYWPGDAEAGYQEATSDFATVTVEKWSSTISLNVYPTNVPVGSSVIINGTIDTLKPILPYEKVTILYKRADGKWTTLATVYPGEDGVYTYTWETNETGSYTLRADWEGDNNSRLATSAERTVEVTGESNVYLFYIIAAIAIIAIATIGIYFTKIRKRQHATDK